MTAQRDSCMMGCACGRPLLTFLASLSAADFQEQTWRRPRKVVHPSRANSWAAATRAVKYGDELSFLDDASPEKRAAAEEHMANVQPDPSERADHPLSNQANRERQAGGS